MFGFFRRKKPSLARAQSFEEATQILEEASKKGEHVIINLDNFSPEELGKFAIPVERTKKPGRNDLCPCGSGQKYKKCCLHH